jgi:hypothetical protein
MSSYSHPNSTYRKILDNARNPIRLRIAALMAMSRPELAQMMRLERDPTTPDKLRFVLAQRRAAEMLIRKASNATMDPAREQDNTPSNSR